MRAFTQTPSQKTSATSEARRRSQVEPTRAVSPIQKLQSRIGNQALRRMLRTHAETSKKDAEASERARSPGGFGPTHGSAPAAIQAKLTVNTPGDAYEQEADRVADQVMRMPAPGHSSERGYPTRAGGQSGGGQVRTKPLGANASTGAAAPPIVHEVLRSPGQPLDAATRAFMEPRFGRDFGDVRVHTDAKAAEAAEAVNARAFTVGGNVVFGAGQFGSHTREQKALLAHEIVHVIQDSKDVVHRQSESPPIPWDPAWELFFKAEFVGTIDNQTKHTFKVQMSEPRKGASKFDLDLKPNSKLGGASHPAKGPAGQTLTDVDFVLPRKDAPINSIPFGKFKIGWNHAVLTPVPSNIKYSIISNYAGYTENMKE